MPEEIEELSELDCWEVLRRNELGRLGFHLLDEVHIVPVNYAVDGESLLFRTVEGSKLLGVVLNSNVAFEVEEVGTDVARSVVLHGEARQLDEHEAHRIEQLPLHTWVPGERYEVVEIRPTSISGREFPLERPWTHMRV
ncbi:MAG TPA: pyridoxamine 5'-phosphate oxidase family protein [Marmoricola sp.]|jgi:nitroimidazol reductase NimA-like FMN-containing flavoprotein (pyridoxamine 5'-phosphate oxidase superfamily)|nr:pyridoxamine 5'-phosphate oxidase family protein [Marmoricola sp.]